MKATQLATFSAIWAGTVVGLASPASAEALTGPYTAVIGNGPTINETWTFTPCGPGCTNLTMGNQAVRQLHLEGSTWKWSENQDGVMCITTIDSTTLAGLFGCVPMTLPLQLTKAG